MDEFFRISGKVSGEKRKMKRKQRKSIPLPWYEKLGQRVQNNYNSMEKGTTEKKILENPFIKRAHHKIMIDYGIRMMEMCFFGLGFAAFLFYSLNRTVERTELSFLTEGTPGDILILLLLLIGTISFSYVENTLFHSADKVMQKYWTCPFCHRQLPYKIGGRMGRFYLLPGAKEDGCPYCGKRLRIPTGEKSINRRSV